MLQSPFPNPSFLKAVFQELEETALGPTHYSVASQSPHPTNPITTVFRVY